MPRTKEQFEKIRESRKIQILESALELFAREGYGHVSISMLSQHAGISKGLMYNYFESKEELLQQVVDYAIKELLEYFDPNQDGVLTRDEYVLFIRKTFELMKAKKEFYTKFFGLIIQPNVSSLLKNSAIVTIIEQYFVVFENYFRDQGFDDPRLEVLNLAIIIEGLGMVMLFYNQMTDIPDDLFEKFEDRLIKTYAKK